MDNISLRRSSDTLTSYNVRKMKINASVIFDLIGFYADLNLYLVRILDVIIIMSKHQRQCFITFLNTEKRGENKL